VTILFSFGHSTRSADEIVATLRAHAVERVADVRAYPGSRRFPHVASDTMRDWLGEAGIEYVHLPSLGGRRRPQPGSQNGGWTNAQFQGYADHMAGDEFRAGLAELLELCAGARTTCMCSEAQWWRCHRRMICDAALVAGHSALHIMSATQAVPHELTPFAHVSEDGRLTYPPTLEACRTSASKST
jgi:uncharacterized protein (DUF488 family)